MNSVIADFAQEHGIDVNIIEGIICVENRSRQAFDFMGRPVIRFELHQFYKYITPDKKWMADRHFLLNGNLIFDHFYTYNGTEYKFVHMNQESEYIALTIARVIDNNAALLSTAFGVGQIMGFNYKSAGYKTVDAMFQDAATEDGQYRMMLNFMANNKTFISAAKERNLEALVAAYNGPGNVEKYLQVLQYCMEQKRGF